MDGDEAMLDKDDVRDDNFQLIDAERSRTRSIVIDDAETISLNSENGGDLSGIY